MHQFHMVMNNDRNVGIHPIDGDIQSKVQLQAWKNIYFLRYMKRQCYINAVVGKSTMLMKYSF